MKLPLPLLIALAALPAWATHTCSTCYIDWVGGNDANSGASTGLAWKHAPGMIGAGGNALSQVPVAGDKYIFKGGVTWPNAAFGWFWLWSGNNTGNNEAIPGCNGTGCIYIGVDQTWFTGASWARPIIDLQGAVVAPQFSIDNVVVYLHGNYLVFDNFEITNFFWTGSQNGNHTIILLAGGVANTSTHVEVENVYIHHWTHDPFPTAHEAVLTLGDTTTPSLNVNSIFHNNVIDGSEGDGISGSCFFSSAPYIRNNYCAHAVDGFVGNGITDVSGNTFLNIPPSFENSPPAHTNGIEINEAQNFTISNNLIGHLGSGTLGMWLAPDPNFTATVFNNVLFDTDVGNIIDAAPVEPGGVPSPAGHVILYNNTVECGPDTNPNAQCVGIDSHIQSVIIENGHWITNSNAGNPVWFTNGVTPTCTPTASCGIRQTKLQANNQGYLASGSFPFLPSGAGDTVGAGTNLTSQCTGTLAGLCVDAAVGVGYNTTNHTVIVPNRTQNARSASVAWDAGAYSASPTTVLSNNPTTINFGNQQVGVTSASQAVTVTNIGSVPATISSCAITGAAAASFAITDPANCPGALGAGSSFTQHITFTPAGAGAVSANYSISGNASSSTTLNGTGTSASPVLNNVPTTIAYGNQNLSTTSAAQLITVTNNGTGLATISSCTLAGQFSSTDLAANCPATLAVNASFTAHVAFAPTLAGVASGSLTITYDAGATSVTSLSGTGVDPNAITMLHVTACAGQSYTPSAPCTIPATTSGNLIPVGITSAFGFSPTVVSITGTGVTCQEAGTSRSIDANTTSMSDLWYCTTTGGTTTLTITLSGSGRAAAVIWEFSKATQFDQAGVPLNSQPKSTTPSGPSITASTSNEVLISVVNPEISVTGIHAGNPCTNDSFVFSGGWAHLITSSTGAVSCQWDASSSGTFNSSAATFRIPAVAANTSGGISLSGATVTGVIIHQ